MLEKLSHYPSLKIGDFIDISLNESLTPVCIGSETKLSKREENENSITNIIGEYVGCRQKLIKIYPIDKKLLDDPRLSRYVVINTSQIKEAHHYKRHSNKEINLN